LTIVPEDGELLQSGEITMESIMIFIKAVLYICHNKTSDIKTPTI